MIRVTVIVEGQTEETFVKGTLAQALWPRKIYVTPIILGVPGHKGGRTNYARVRKDLLRQLKQDRNAYCSTMIDFYGLGEGFPHEPLSPDAPGIERVEHIESAIKWDICSGIPDLRPDLRLISYLSLHEYEALLFSDPQVLAQAVERPALASRFRQIRDGFPTPEDINDGPDTSPSKRIAAVYPAYRKVIDGELAAGKIGIDKMRIECPHFNAWLKCLEQLPELR